jgi:hypothetical protein
LLFLLSLVLSPRRLVSSRARKPSAGSLLSLLTGVSLLVCPRTDLSPTPALHHARRSFNEFEAGKTIVFVQHKLIEIEKERLEKLKMKAVRKISLTRLTPFMHISLAKVLHFSINFLDLY